MELKPTAHSHFWTETRSTIFIFIGIAIYSVGFSIFILPHHIVIGGMTGFATLIYYATGGVMPVAVTMYGANLLLLAMGAKVLGRGFVLRTIFGATVLAVLIGSMEGYFTSHPPLIDSAAVSSVIGAVLCGFGIGIYYSHNGTCGGTDIIAAILTHFSDVSMGRVMMIVDASIVALSFLLPFDGDWEERLQVRTQTIIFGWIVIYVYSTLADRYLSAGKQTVQFIIISDKWEEISYRISHEAGRGVTMWEGKGYWTGEKRVMLMSLCRKPEIMHINSIIVNCDPKAYITITSVRTVFGNGFDAYRLPKRK